MPLRLVLLGACLEIVGDGPAVINTILIVIAAEAVSEEDRSSTFLRIHAIGIAAAVVTQLTGSLLMSIDAWIPWFVSIFVLLVSAVMATVIPNRTKMHSDLVLGAESTENSPLLGVAEDSSEMNGGGTLRTRYLDAIKQLSVGVNIVCGNGQVLILIYASFLNELCAMSYGMILLLYISKWCTWDFATASLYFLYFISVL